MLNPYENCACFSLDPTKQDKAALDIEERNKDVVWIQFRDDFFTDDLSAMTLSHMFSKFGDFQLFKDSRKSCLLYFFYIEKMHVSSSKIADFIALMKKPENMDEYKIKDIRPYSQIELKTTFE
mmetsp:Transcript_9009/g.15245  ORF Transcript_9009/g.15245 Transcript_9009/m.15245 type:complete len:123 (-) Transcript_9009:140-508(-)